MKLLKKFNGQSLRLQPTSTQDLCHPQSMLFLLFYSFSAECQFKFMMADTIDHTKHTNDTIDVLILHFV